jgi:predicted nucleotidyltransferase component of viral defense system
VKNIVESVKARLQNQARAKGKPFNELLQYYAIERFLYRLSLSPYRDNFVLKGGLIFLALGLPLRRPTRDIDLRGFTQNSAENLIQIARAVCLQPVEEDGLTFRPETVEAEAIQLDADYQGIRVTLRGGLGKAEVVMQLDIGFTDTITPAPVELHYPSQLDMPQPVLHGYPSESVISEKLHAIVHLAEINSRMKDYYDLWLLANWSDFDGPILQTALDQTFQRRATDIPSDVPVGLSAAFAAAHQRDWLIFLKRADLEKDELSQMNHVLANLRAFLLPPMQALTQGVRFDQRWKAGKGWE